jgi:hypothetical protein
MLSRGSQPRELRLTCLAVTLGAPTLWNSQLPLSMDVTPTKKTATTMPESKQFSLLTYSCAAVLPISCLIMLCLWSS